HVESMACPFRSPPALSIRTNHHCHRRARPCDADRRGGGTALASRPASHRWSARTLLPLPPGRARTVGRAAALAVAGGGLGGGGAGRSRLGRRFLCAATAHARRLFPAAA